MPTKLDLLTIPKVLLHEHLDGGLRLSTLFELLSDRGIEPPATTLPVLADWFATRAHAGTLVEYLRGFALTVAAMADRDALERVAFEAADDAHRDGCVLAEFRIAPILFEPYGIDLDAATEALVAGLRRATRETGMPCGLIVRDAVAGRARRRAHGRPRGPSSRPRRDRLRPRRSGEGFSGDAAGGHAGAGPRRRGGADTACRRGRRGRSRRIRSARCGTRAFRCRTTPTIA